MIVLDTNVISELWKPSPDAKVLAWVDTQMAETLYLSSVTVAELRFGLACMPQGKRRSVYQDRLEMKLLPAFLGRILPFDESASKEYARIMARARAAGEPLGIADGYIAATVSARGFMIATRDTRPFISAHLQVINPWRDDLHE